MEHLFKYTKLDFLLRILDKCELYFPSPVTFNDPFDCRIHPRFDDDAAVCRYYERSLKAKKVPRAERRRLTKQVRPGRALAEQAFELAAEDIRKTRGVLCLSEVNNDILMWSHYAEKHSGVCLRFDPASEFLKEARPVHYADKYPKMDFIRVLEDLAADGAIRERADEELSTTLFLTKSSHWKYEHEWRVGMFSLTESTVGFRPFPPEALAGIIFGVHTPQPAIERVKSRVRLSRCKPELFRAEVSRTDFALDIRPLP
jgi:Protein of unknown function (DUF2971)